MKSKGNRVDARSEVSYNDVGRSKSTSKDIIRGWGLSEIEYYAMLLRVEFIIIMETMSTWALHVENTRVRCRNMMDIKDFDVGRRFLMTGKSS